MTPCLPADIHLLHCKCNLLGWGRSLIHNCLKKILWRIWKILKRFWMKNSIDTIFQLL